MHRIVEFVVAMAALTVLLLVSSESLESSYERFGGHTGRSQAGVPFVHYEYVSLPPIDGLDSHIHGSSNPEALMANRGVFASIAILSILLAFRHSSPNRPASPMASSDPRGQALLRRSRWCLLATVVGSVLGLGLAFGPLGWWWGRRLCQDHEVLGHPPPWMAAAAWTAGRAITVTMLVCLIALVTR